MTETTYRDAHQSLLATRVRTRDLVRVGPHVARMTPGLLSVEAWGGATYDVALRFLAEDPWERLAAVREAIPNIPIQMLLRGRNTVGYTPRPDEVAHAFVREAAATGVDIFRIFDALNDVSQMRPAIDAVLETGTAVAEVAVCYTADLLDPSETLYTLDYYLRLADTDRRVGRAHPRDQGHGGSAAAGGRGEARHGPARALRPAGPPAHARHRGRPARHAARRERRGGGRGGCCGRAAVGHDEPALPVGAGRRPRPHRARHRHRPRRRERPRARTGKACAHLYSPFESGLPGPTGRVYHHEIPGGQLSNLRQQAIALGMADDFERIEDMYAAADRILGRIPKVTPSSKVVGDLALALVAANADPADFAENPQNYDIPDSVVGFMAGELGDLPGGWPEPFRTKVLAGRQISIDVPPLTDAEREGLEGDTAARRRTLSRLLFPGPAKDFESNRETYGDLSALGTPDYLYGLKPGEEHIAEIDPGVQLYVGLEAIGEADAKGIRTVMTTLNGQLRPVYVRDRSINVDSRQAERADTSKPGQVAAPFSGVVTLKAAVGDTVTAGQPVASIEAMKMEAAITSPVDGVVERLAIGETQQVEAGDLLVVIRPGQ